MKKICFAVPTFPGHYLYAADFIKSFKENKLDEQADLVFIFTNPAERDGFLPCKSIVLPPKLRILRDGKIINIKKFYALMQLKDEYEYIFMIDDECLFRRNVDLYSICQNYFKQKILYGNRVENAPWDFPNIIPAECGKFFSKEQQKKLKIPVYLWFNQLPIYRTSDLNDFFKTTGIDKNIADLCYFNFDYYVYMFYLILKCDFTVMDIGIIADCAVSEIQNYSFYKVLRIDESVKIYMCTDYAKQTFNFKDAFISIHLDRLKTQDSKLKKFVKAIKKYRQVKKIIS